MDRPDYPIISAHLVFPSLRTCQHGSHEYPALVFAEHGAFVLFAAEYARRFGVGVLDEAGRVVQADQFPTLDDAARHFLARKRAA
jgi:hypothetical protein